MYKNLNCNEMNELLSAYLDNELSQGLDEVVEDHLENCDNCMKKLLRLKKMKALLNSSASNQTKHFDTQSFVPKLKPYLDEIDSCRFVEENLNDYIDGELDSTSETRICEHLKKCKYCNYDYENMLELKKTLRSYFYEDSGIDINENLFQKVMKRLKKARLMDYLTVSFASVIASLLVWFSFSALTPVHSDLKQDSSIRQVNMKYCIEADKADSVEKKTDDKLRSKE